MYDATKDLEIIAEALGWYISRVFDVSDGDTPLEVALGQCVVKSCIVDWRIRPLTPEFSTFKSSRSDLKLPYRFVFECRSPSITHCTDLV
jgi:hypothetical protein